MRVSPASRLDFALPAGAEATEPPEARGLARDEVRLLVAGAEGVQHARFRDLPRHLSAGDTVVINTSATLAAAIDGRRGDGRGVTVHFSNHLADGSWAVELRGPSGPTRDASPGERLHLPAGVVLTLTEAYPDPTVAASRLRRAEVAVEGRVEDYLARHGRPITYGYLHGQWPLAAYQTVFARVPGSAEMPSAARPLTAELVTELVTRGVVLAPVTLHCGVSSLEAGEAPLPERYDVPAATAELVNAARRRGSRVVAVGTTVVRAVESAAAGDGTVRAARGWTDLVLGPGRRARVVDALVTGFHEPGASHLALLEAVAGPDLVRRAYDAALAGGYRWHEFGDTALLRGPLGSGGRGYAARHDGGR